MLASTSPFGIVLPVPMNSYNIVPECDKIKYLEDYSLRPTSSQKQSRVSPAAMREEAPLC